MEDHVPEIDAQGRYVGPERRKNWPPEVSMRPDDNWRIDRHINVSVIVGLLTVAASGVWFGGDLNGAIKQLARDNYKNELEIAQLRQTTATADQRMARIEERTEALFSSHREMLIEVREIRRLLSGAGGPR